MEILIKNGKVIDPVSKKTIIADILVEKGKISKIGGTIKTKTGNQIDASDKIVASGFIDLHTHLREPGREDAETIETGLKAAVVGGFTTVCAMPNTDPPCDTQAHAKFLLEKATKVKLANIIPVGTITKERKGETLAEIGELKESGCLMISDDGDSVKDAALMRKALEYSSMIDILVSDHCEDKELSQDGVMNEGYFSTVLGMKPIPAEAESTIIERDIRLAEMSGARIHIEHVSAAQSVEIIRQAKKRGVQVTAEVTPHHFSLKDEDLKSFDTNLKMNPPLRGTEDIKALIKGLKDGTIDAIATDHAPHPENDKEKEFDYAPFGIIGLETALSLSVLKLVEPGHLSWAELMQKLSFNPARILKYDRGLLKEGEIADIVIIDPEKEWVYEKEKIKSKSKNSPFIGKTMKAKVTDVIVNGRIILKNENFV